MKKPRQHLMLRGRGLYLNTIYGRAFNIGLLSSCSNALASLCRLLFGGCSLLLCSGIK